MKKITLIFFAILFATCTLKVMAQSEDEMKKWMEYMTPSEMQKMMSAWDGEWNESITMWSTPGADPQQMKATCVNKMIVGGRYQESKHTGDFMGMPFEGIGTTGWDNAGKYFVSSWVDNFGTGMIYMEGTWDENNKSMKLAGKMTDPMTGKSTNIRQVMKIIDDNNQMMEQFVEKDGKDFKNMEIKFTRNK